MSKEIILVGAFIEIIELAEENGYTIVGFFDNVLNDSYCGYKNFGTDDQAKNHYLSLRDIPVLLTPDKPEQRVSLAKYYNNIGYKFSALISEKSQVSKSAIIGDGSIIQNLVNVSSECVIGKYVKLNTFCNVMHNSIIGDFTTIAPNAVILGNVEIGDSCYIGSNATVLPGVTITDKVVIGAGAVVTKNIVKSGTYVGVPAKLHKK
ncbi:MAG: acetyltransferase [Thiohalospira sp.]